MTGSGAALYGIFAERGAAPAPPSAAGPPPPPSPLLFSAIFAGVREGLLNGPCNDGLRRHDGANPVAHRLAGRTPSGDVDCSRRWARRQDSDRSCRHFCYI